VPAGAGPLVEHFFRHEYGRLVASLTRRFGAARLDRIEEAVQTALARALSAWLSAGVPDNASAWLTRVAHNALVDELRREQASEGRTRELGSLHPERSEAQTADEVIADDQLRMLFVCCDDALPERARLVLALKLLCGFSTREIAHRLFATEATVHKLLQRGKAQLAELWQPDLDREFLDPTSERLAARLPAVQRVVYLLFNQGYSSHDADEGTRRDLCTEAVRLCQLLVSLPGDANSSSWALLALLHFHAARSTSRRDGQGDLLMLEEQDRSGWDRHQIQLGVQCLRQSWQGQPYGRYHAEAAVLAEHCLAPSFEQTRWGEIVEIYELVERIEPSPLYTLNRAIALSEWKGPRAGLDLLREHAPPSWLSGYYLWDGTIGELLRRAGDFDAAFAYLERAISACPTAAERRLFERRLAWARAKVAARSG
jgi:RNA polymerase sigma-70 factor (ECF subfamily)